MLYTAFVDSELDFVCFIYNIVQLQANLIALAIQYNISVRQITLANSYTVTFRLSFELSFRLGYKLQILPQRLQGEVSGVS